jgi:hypothetical protein
MNIFNYLFDSNEFNSFRKIKSNFQLVDKSNNLLVQK